MICNYTADIGWINIIEHAFRNVRFLRMQAFLLEQTLLRRFAYSLMNSLPVLMMSLFLLM